MFDDDGIFSSVEVRGEDRKEFVVEGGTGGYQHLHANHPAELGKSKIKRIWGKPTTAHELIVDSKASSRAISVNSMCIVSILCLCGKIASIDDVCQSFNSVLDARACASPPARS